MGAAILIDSRWEALSDQLVIGCCIDQLSWQVIGMWEFHPGIQTFRAAVDENEGLAKAQNSRALIFASRSCQSRAEDRSSETLTVNQLSANRLTTLTNLAFGAESRALQKSGKVSNRLEM